MDRVKGNRMQYEFTTAEDLGRPDVDILKILEFPEFLWTNLNNEVLSIYGQGQHSLVVDLQDLEKIDISGVSVLDELESIARAFGARLHLAGLRKEFEELLETYVSGRFVFFESVTLAVLAFP